MMFAMLSDAVLDIPLTHVKEINDERTARYVPPGEFKDQVCHLNVVVGLQSDVVGSVM